MPIGICSALRQSGAHIVDMNPCSGRDILPGIANDAAVFDYRCSTGNARKRQLMAPLDILQRRDGQTAKPDALAFRQRL